MTEPLGTVESVSVQWLRYRDAYGKPTCAADFSCGRVCALYRTQRFGTREICLLGAEDGAYTETLQRREKNGKREGTLIPHECCPFWQDRK